MLALEEPKQRKRKRTSQEPADVEQVPIAKKQKSISESPIEPHHQSHSFWDTLSKIRLTRSALKEFDRRNTQEAFQPYSIPTPVAEYPTGRAGQRLKRFARCGGPELSYLRGVGLSHQGEESPLESNQVCFQFADAPLPVDNKMSNSADSQSRKRSDSTKTSKISPKSGNFEQKMIDNGIYPSLYKHPDGRREKPANWDDIHGRIPVSRASLSSSRFTDAHFEAFEGENERASSETTVMNKVIPIITGNEDKRHRPQGDIWFTNLKKFDEDLTTPKPDVYYGTQPSEIHQHVRTDLAPHIIPSKGDTTRPAVPNFFLERKSQNEPPYVAENQALYNGAIGARAMHSLQNFGADEPVYDNKAYSFSCTYQSPVLQIYTTHPTQPKEPGGKPEYHMTRLKTYAMTSDRETFVNGATAFRNIRDLGMTNRDNFIDQANQAARQMPASSPTTTFTDTRTSLSALVEDGSNTSEDELAHDEAIIKRPRTEPTQRPSRQESATGRYSRTRSSMAPPQDQLQGSSHRERLSLEQDALARPKPSKRYPGTPFSTDGRRDSARQPRNMRDSGQRRVSSGRR
jgi:hypothetical protein